MGLILCHFIGDYFLQSDWMATKKGTSLWVAAYHALWYTIPFLFITQSWLPLLTIWGTHAIIDRYKPVPYLALLKNTFPLLSPVTLTIRQGKTVPSLGDEEIFDRRTGYPFDRPVWLTTWLNIIQDNVLHIVINFLALKYGG